MKILIGCSAAPDSSGGGIATYTRELSEALVARGHEVHFLSPTPRDHSWLRAHGIRHVASNQQDDPLAAATAVLRYTHDNKIDAAINNDNSLLQSVAPGLRCPFVVIGHFNTTSIAALACYRPEWSDYVVAISNDMQQDYVRRYSVPLTKCPIVFNGVKDPGHDGNFDRRDPAALRIVYAGGFNRMKGADHILTMVLRDSPVWEGLRLDWYGVVPDKFARRAASNPHVHIHGRVPRDEVLQSLRTADILLFPSRLEGCPMAILEAMSMGVVPIASDGVGAMRWLITSGKEGYICQLAQWPEQALEVLAHLRDHADVLAHMKQATRKRFLADFQISRVTEDILRLIRQPTVDRFRPASQFEILRWHRPLRPDGLKAPLPDRICYRIGYLRTHSMIEAGHLTGQ